MSGERIVVAHFSNETVRGGAEEHILTLLRGLDRRLFRLYLICPSQLADKLAPDLPADVGIVRLSLRRPRHVGAALQLASVLRGRRIDILHSHLFYASAFASPIAWGCRVPAIIETPHGREQWRTGWLKRRFVVDRFVGLFVDRYIAVSNANAQYLADEKGLPAHKIVVIHNGCDMSRFRVERSPQLLRRSLGFGESDPVLVVVGRLEPQKGHRVLLDAMPTIVREFPSTHLVCVGDGSLRPELEQQGRRLGVESNVRFVGYQTNVEEWLALADVTVLPSFYEGLPLVALESLAAKRPMVASAVDGTPELIQDGRTGFTVRPGDPGLLADAIGRLLRDPLLRERLALAGHELVRRSFTHEEQLAKTQELYVTAWRQGRRPWRHRERLSIDPPDTSSAPRSPTRRPASPG